MCKRGNIFWLSFSVKEPSVYCYLHAYVTYMLVSLAREGLETHFVKNVPTL